MDFRAIVIKAYAKDHSVSETEELIAKLFVSDGGDGSGNYGHGGRPGHIGGSTSKAGGRVKPRAREEKTKNSAGKRKILLTTEPVHELCKLDRKIYSCVTNSISTDDVIVTNERIDHVVNRHPEINRDEVFEMMKDAVEKPDVIIQDSHKDHENDTAVVMKRIGEKKLHNGSRLDANMRLILRLSTTGNGNDQKNSVITAVLISSKKWNKYMRNKKILYKRDGEIL